MVSQVGSGPVWVPQGDGDGSALADWAGVDTSLVKADDGSVTAAAVSGEVALSGGGQGSAESPVELAGMTDPESGVRVSALWPGVLPAPVLQENRATYKDVAPGLDVVVELKSTGFEQFYVARDEAALESAALLPVTIATEGGTVAATDEGGLEVAGPDGAVVGSSGVPLAWDAATDELLDSPVLADPAPVEGPQLPPLRV
jgi:hypothetical protein